MVRLVSIFFGSLDIDSPDFQEKRLSPVCQSICMYVIRFLAEISQIQDVATGIPYAIETCAFAGLLGLY